MNKNCKSFQFPLIKIPNESTNIKKYLDNKLDCINITKSNNIIDITNDRIIKINEIFEQSFPAGEILNKYFPVIVYLKNNGNQYDFINQDNIIIDDGVGECELCTSTHVKSFSDNMLEKNILGNYLPELDNTTLIFKNFMIIFNDDPYMKDHLMIITLNHKNNSLKGSQYEILNREILGDIINLFSQINENYIMGHNYALVGSQSHFHIHLFRKIPNKRYGLDICIDDIITHSNNTEYNNSDDEQYKFTKNFDSINYTCYVNKLTEYIKIISFKENDYGYKGYIISIAKDHLINKNVDIQTFINVVYNFLNYIETSIEYTFNLYFPSSTTYNSILILIQYRINTKSFRSITQFIFMDSNVDVSLLTDYLNYNKRLIEEYVLIDIIDDEIIYDLLINKPVMNSSVYGNNNLRHVIDLPDNSYKHYFTNFIKFIKNKPSVPEPKVIIINAPIGAGKSLLFKNIKSYFPFYNENDYVHINVDELINKIPGYKKFCNKTSKYLTSNFLNKPFNDYQNEEVHIYGTKTINDLRDNNLMHELTINDYELIYNELTNTILTPGSEKTLGVEHIEYFSKIKYHMSKLLRHILSICEKHKFNIIIENARTNWWHLESDLPQLLINKHNIYYLGLYFDNNEFNKKFILRNILIRNIKQGRYLNYDYVNCLDYDDVVKSYKYNILPDNFILINIGMDIKFDDISDDDINNLKLFKDSFYTKNTNIDYTNHNEQTIDNDMFICTPYINNINNINKTDDNNLKYKNIVTQINNKYLLDENNTSILINNTVNNINNIINIVIKKHNLTENDIKLVLKGDLNFRFILRNFFETFQKFINLKNNKENIEFENIIKSMDGSLDYSNPFKNTTSKSNIEFIILIKKSDKYDDIQKDIRLLTIKYLFDLRFKLHITKFFGKGYNINILNKNKNEMEKIGLKKIENINSNCVFIDYVTKPSTTTTKCFLYPHDYFLDDTISSDLFNKQYKYYISYEKLNLSKPNKDILSIRNRYITEYDTTINDIECNIMDIIINDNNSTDDNYLDQINEIKYTNNMYSFKFNIFNETYLLNELIFTIFKESIFPWENPNVDNKINKFFLLFTTIYIKQKPDITILDGLLNNGFLNNVKINTLLESIKDDKLSALSALIAFFTNLIELDKEINQYSNDNSTLKEKLSDYYYKILSDTEINNEIIIINKNLDDFINKIDKLLTNVIKMVNLIIPNINKLTMDALIDTNSLTLVQWGGYKKIYCSYKKHYFNLKGGVPSTSSSSSSSSSYLPYDYTSSPIDFNNYDTNFFVKTDFIDYNGNPSYYIRNISGVYHYFNFYQQRYITFLYSSILPMISWDDNMFGAITLTPYSCGASGCGFKLIHQRGKKFILKICGGYTDVPYDVPYDISYYKKEIYNAYYTVENKMDIFNETYGYLTTSFTNSDIFFKSHNHRLSYNNMLNNDNDIISHGNIFTIIMNGGDGDLTKLIKSIIDNILPESIIKTLKNINNQMFQIANIYRCSKISRQCTYLIHSDIKPENMIYTFDDSNNSYKINFIDFGEFIFSENFFTKLGFHTIYMRSLVNDEDDITSKIASPLYDIASTIYTMFMILTGTAELTDDLENDIWELKSLYAIKDADLNNIYIKYNNISKILLKIIENDIFGCDTYNDNIDKYIRYLSQYLNLAMCIYRYRILNKDIFTDDLTYNEIDFENFELLNLTYDMVPIEFVTIRKDLINNELLDAIINTVEGKLSIFNI
jgi:hypothetical protein